jgi:D-alanyl-D-alanine carboxypeptidase/D-alanyl-D-alanine-endopeptidase (penicillin-binding protein 4)
LAELRARLDNCLNAPRFTGALWGVQIVSLKTGKTIYSYHPDRLMSPASNSKLYTAALALDTLGGDYRISTPVSATILPDDFGRINGDLIISGRGDPSWKAAKFWDNFAPIVSVLTNADVRSISGDLVVDDTFFQGPPIGSSWCVDDLSEGFGAEMSALSLEDNLTHIRVIPGKTPGETCKLDVVWPDTQITLINRIGTTPPGGRAHLEAYRPPGSKKYYVIGELPAGGGDEDLEVPVPEPALWFGTTLKDVLAQHGIEISGTVRTVAWPDLPSWNQTNLATLGEVSSPPLRDLILGFMKPSQNLEADLIFEHVGECLRKLKEPSGDFSEMLAVAGLERFLSAKGIPAEVHFNEGSGLSRNNLASAAATTALLAAMSTNRWAADFINALPIAGVDGTLRYRMRNTTAYQNVRAKTGTLRWANSLSGYVTTAAGEKLAFSLMLNRFDPPAGINPTGELDSIAVMLADYDGHSDE